MNFQDTLQGQRITLKRTKPTIETATHLFSLVDSNRDYLRKWLKWVDYTKNAEDSMQYLFKKEQEVKDKIKIGYGIYLQTELIGTIGLLRIKTEHNSAEIGYWLSQKHTGKGYITEAVKVLEKEAFTNLNFNRIQITCDDKNIPSANVAQRCGYQLEGNNKQDFFSTYDDTYRNTLVFAKLKSEYQEQT